MPFSIFHLYIAQDHLPKLEPHYFPDKKFLGLYYFGSVFPDSHIILDQSEQLRHELHFSLKSPDPIETVEQMRQSLAWDFSNPYHQAFFLGFANHLIVDKVYVEIYYGPYFGINGYFKDKKIYHDIFRYYLNSLYPVYSDKSIVQSIRLAPVDQLTGLFKSSHLKSWQKIIINQIKAAGSIKKYFLSLAGDKTRYQQDIQNYNLLLPEILQIVSPKDLNNLLKSIDLALTKIKIN